MITVIPAIDIIDGKCVRLEQGDYRLKKVYEKDPVDTAKRFEDFGLKRLHVVDLDGAKAKQVINWKTLERIASKTRLVIDFGGGIKTDNDLKIVFDSGASLAVIGSIAVTDRDLFQSWLIAYGTDRFILGADIREGNIAVSGWLEDTDIGLFDFLMYYKGIGISQVLCTDITKDGMMKGSSTDLYKSLAEDFPSMGIIASGGVSSIDEIHLLNEYGVAGVIIGKALYEGLIKLEELKEFL